MGVNWVGMPFVSVAGIRFYEGFGEIRDYFIKVCQTEKCFS